MSSKVIGEGTYGCVLKPSLKCKNKSVNYKDKVSKVMLDYDAYEEAKEYDNISKIEGLEKYAITGPDYCKPYIDDVFNKSVKQCKNDKVKRMFNYNKNALSLLILQDGGINLDKYLKQIFPKQSLDEKKIFLTSIINLIDGLIFFKQKNIMHRDIKLLNIVYNVNTGESKFIDFGLMTTKDKYIHNCKNNKERLGISWNYFPPENSCTNKAFFLDEYNTKCTNIRNYFKNHDEFLNHMVNNFDIYCFSYAMMDFIKYLNYSKFSIYFIKDLSGLLVKYNIVNPSQRSTNIEEFKTEYIKILKKHNLYLNKTPSPTSKIQNIVDSIEKKEQNEIDKKCPSNKPILNPKTGRCVIECKSGFVRNKDFKCVSGIQKKQKNNKSKKIEKNSTTKKKDCESQGKIYNPVTKRCNKKTEKIKKTSADKIKDCESKGKIYNPKTKRCNKKI